MTCDAIDGDISSMRQGPECQLIEVNIHRAECTFCGKKGWFSLRGRLADQKGVTLEGLTDDEYENPEKYLEALR